MNRVAKALTSQLLPTRHRPRPENHRHGASTSRPSPTTRRGRRGRASTGYTHSSILVTSLATLPLHQRPQCGAQIRMQLVTLDRLADHRQGGDRVRRLAGRVAPAGAVRVSQRRHRVSNHNGLRAPHFEPPKLAAPRCRCRCRCHKFAPGPLAPRAGPGCVPARPARRRGARPPPTSPRGAAPGRPGRPPTKLLYYYHITVRVGRRATADSAIPTRPTPCPRISAVGARCGSASLGGGCARGAPGRQLAPAERARGRFLTSCLGAGEAASASDATA